MRPQEEHDAVRGLVRFGLNDCQISRLTGIPLSTVRGMRVRDRAPRAVATSCPRCHEAALDTHAYAYLLGVYLGDGHIARCPKDVYRLDIGLDRKYPRIVDECVKALGALRAPRLTVSRRQRPGCTIIFAFWKHWPCLFPQHGPGRKHERDVSLQPWQQEIADRYPDRLLRGLIHSDGSRDQNVVKGKAYPRYQFSNNSLDIQEIFRHACEKVGVKWTQPWWKTLAVSRRPDVERLDEFIGPKT